MIEQTLPAEGKPGIIVPGSEAVATTFIAVVEAVRKELAQHAGSLTLLNLGGYKKFVDKL